MAGSKPASAPQRTSAWAAAFASVAIRTAAPGKAAPTSRPSGSSPQPSIVGASSTRSSNGIPKVDTPTATTSRPGAAAASTSRAACTPRSKLARAPSSPPLDTVVDARSSPSGSHTAMAILVPPKSRPRMTGESATEYLSRGDAPPAPGGLVPGTISSCSILLGQYPNYQMATRPLRNRLATVGRRDNAAGRPVLRPVAGPRSAGGGLGSGFSGRLIPAPGPAGPAHRAAPGALRSGPPADARGRCGNADISVGAATTMTSDWPAG